MISTIEYDIWLEYHKELIKLKGLRSDVYNALIQESLDARKLAEEQRKQIYLRLCVVLTPYRYEMRRAQDAEDTAKYFKLYKKYTEETKAAWELFHKELADHQTKFKEVFTERMESWKIA